MNIAEIDLARGEILPSDEAWILVDIRRMAKPTVGGPRDTLGGTTWYADRDHPEDIKQALREAKLLARRRAETVIYVRGRHR